MCGVTNMNDMDNSFLITTEIQRKWIEKFKVIEEIHLRLRLNIMINIANFHIKILNG